MLSIWEALNAITAIMSTVAESDWLRLLLYAVRTCVVFSQCVEHLGSSTSQLLQSSGLVCAIQHAVGHEGFL